MSDKIAQVGVSPDEMIKVLNQLMTSNDDNLIYTQIENLRSRVQSPEQSDRLGQILGAIKVPNSVGSGIQIRDPESGSAYPNTKNFIKEYISELQGHKKMSKSFNFEKFAQKDPQKKKKDSRGNPFRVLMGQVGKLLDHGLEKRDIVRYLLKEKKWNESTIEKAVKIVKDYNKKKYKKRNKEAQTLLPNAPDWEKGNPDYSKRSSGELITSICWLNSLASFDPKSTFTTKEVFDRSGVKTMIRQIKAELLKRGMSEEELNKIL